MPRSDAAQIPGLRIGVDVGGTFTDLVASDGTALHVVKIPSSPPAFHRAVIEAVRLARRHGAPLEIIHGSTVATNALLQRAGAPVAFVTTEGFRDMLLIGRQNRPDLYALNIARPQPLAPEENAYTVRERIGADGRVVEPLDDAEVERLVRQIQAQGLKHVAVCLLFSFINPAHERTIGRACERAGLTVSLSSDVLPEFREYERASTTVINAAMRPVVKEYLEALITLGEASETTEARNSKSESPNQIRMTNDQMTERETMSPADSASAHGHSNIGTLGFDSGTRNSDFGSPVPLPLRIMHSSGGTLSVAQACQSAARLVLSGPAGGVMGAAFVAQQAGFSDVITYDMGGTSTDVAVILQGQPQWTTSTTVDGLPIGLPMFDIHTIGAGGGSVAFFDAGGALRVGPRSAGAVPGPACYNRGGEEPTLTDANLVLGRILPGDFLGGAMTIEPERARRAVGNLASRMNKPVIDTALGIVRVAEANMERAIRHVTTRRGHDPRGFTLVSFGGAGGLHACALAASLDIPRVLIPPYCGVLSALGMIVAPPVVDVSRTVIHLGPALDDQRLIAEFGSVSGQTIDLIPYEQTERVEAYADIRFRGQSHELKIKLDRPTLDHAAERFLEAYRKLYGSVPGNRPIEIVTIRVRRYGRTPQLKLPALASAPRSNDVTTEFVGLDGSIQRARVVGRGDLAAASIFPGPFLLIDPEATTLVPADWQATATENGAVILERSK